MIQTQYPISCKYCNADIIYNAEIKSFVNYGGEFDGLVHRDKHVGSQIEEIDTATKDILNLIKLGQDDITARFISTQESIVSLRREVIDLRKVVRNND